MKMKEQFIKWLIMPAAGFMYQLWFFTVRKKNQTPVPAEPNILAFWHQDIFIAIGFIARHYRGKKIAALVSASGDGDYLARILKSLEIESIRGSSTTGSVKAYWSCLRALKENNILMITPDGPKGPAKKIKPGLAELARHSAKPVNLLRFDYSLCRRLNSWDRFIIPLPFSSVRITLSDPIVFTREDAGTQKITQTMEDYLNGHTAGTGMA